MTADPGPVLRRYPPALAGCRWSPVGGGFSGAEVWRGDANGDPAFALKRWPTGYPVGRLRQVHLWMHAARAAAPFVPKVVPARFGDTVVSAGDRVWDVTSWMPGEPPHSEPSAERIQAACAALADLHRVWSGLHREQALCPAVLRRLALLDEWEHATRPAAFDPLPAELADLLRTSWTAVRDRLVGCRTALLAWRPTHVPVHPCLCDVHADHVLFTGSRVSGVIDYGAMKIDSPAVDVARFLGDLFTPDSPLFSAGLQAYRQANPAAAFPESLVRVLADTGAVCGLANWHLRLMTWLPTGADRVSQRIRKLLARLKSPAH